MTHCMLFWDADGSCLGDIDCDREARIYDLTQVHEVDDLHKECDRFTLRERIRTEDEARRAVDTVMRTDPSDPGLWRELHARRMALLPELVTIIDDGIAEAERRGLLREGSVW